MTTYTRIKRLTGNNNGYAEVAIATLEETCWWIDAKRDAEDIIVLRHTTSNDWVAIPAAYEDEGTEFVTVHGKSVTLTANTDTYEYIAVTVEE